MQDGADYQQTEDFILNDSFVNWVKDQSHDDTSFWENFQKTFPDKTELFIEAKLIVKNLHFQADNPSNETQNRVWAKIEHSIFDSNKFNTTNIFSIFFQKRWRLVASVASVLLLSTILLLQFNKPISYKTAYGETKKVELPDGSIVKLNANSTITFSKNFDADNNREVTLKGEAFFSVTHKDNNQKFIVHTNNDIKIEVIGTEFDVFQRRNDTKVYLKSGEVRLSNSSKNDTQSTMMKPGDMMVYKNKQFILEKAVEKDAINATEWTKNIIVLDNMTLQEMSIYINDLYGLEIKVNDKELLKKRIWGKAPLNNIDELLLGISKTFDWNVEKKGSIVIISKK